jgi:hypothetical protein
MVTKLSMGEVMPDSTFYFRNEWYEVALKQNPR